MDNWLRKLGIACAAPVAGLSVAAAAAAAPDFGLHVVREANNAAAVDAAKRQRELCISEKRNYQQTRKTQPQAWNMMEAPLRKQRPDYDLDRPLAAEPDWKAIGVNRTEEYFYGDAYAEYKTRARFEISTDGGCAVVAKPERRIDIDDGKFRYVINADKNTGSKRVSPAVNQAEAQAAMKERSAEVGAAWAALSGGARPGDAGALPAHRETVAGQPVACLVNVVGKSRVCYWAEHRHYPSQLARPVILKTEVQSGNIKQLDQAVIFEKSPRIDAKHFTPPAGVNLKDQTRR
jgi:hypothetical protein